MKVAIVQDYITYGGRIVVLAEIIRFLNQRNITPDLVGFNVEVSKEEIKNRYDIDLEFNILEAKFNWFSKINEFNKIWFNFIFNFYARRYDLIINSNNSTCLSKARNRIVYVHYPRKKRILQKEYFKFNSDIKFKTRFAVSIDYFVSRILYSLDRPSKFNLVISNSHYTKSVINELYTIDQDKLSTIYPPVNIRIEKRNIPANKNIISIGRISASKNQLMQLEIAKKLKGYTLHIVGFVSNRNNYYKKCLDYISENGLDNVFIHSNLSYDALVEMMNSATYYLHTMENEPFGITTVQAISSGCIPVVHNSGGQREIVPFDELRFDSVEEAANKINGLKEEDINKIVLSLQDHIQQFSTERFQMEMEEIFNRL